MRMIRIFFITILLHCLCVFMLAAEERFSGLPIQTLIESLEIKEVIFSDQLEKTLEELKNNRLKEAFTAIEELSLISITNQQKKDAIIDYLKGVLYQRSGSTDKAIERFLKANSFFQESTISSDVWRWQMLNVLGVSYWGSQEFSQAEIYLKNALSIVRKSSTLDQKIEAYTLNNLGLVELQNKPFDALISFEHSLKIFQSLFIEDHIQVAFSNINISIAYRAVGNYLSSNEFLEKAARTIQKVKGEASVEMAYVFSLKGKLASLKKEDQAIEYFKKSITIYQQQYGTKHPEIAAACQEIALLKEENASFKEALVWLNKAHQANHYGVVNANFSVIPSVSTVINPMHRLVTLMLQARVFRALYEGKTIRRRDLESSFNTYLDIDSLLVSLRKDRSSTADKLLLGQYAADIYPQAALLSLSLAEKSVNARFYKERAFYFSEQLKSVVLKGAITATKALKFAGIPNELLEEERFKKEYIARLENELYASKGVGVEIQTELANAKEGYREFIEQLEVKYPKYYDLKYKSDVVDLSDLKNNLEDHQLLVSYMFCEEEHRLLTFNVSKKGLSVNNEPLNPEINRWITGIRKGLLYDVEEVYKASAIQLGEYLFPKRIPQYVTNLIIIPDPELAAIPFEALLLGRNQEYLIKKVAVSYDVSASLFLERKHNKVEQTNKKHVLLCAPVTFKHANTLLGSEQEVSSLDTIFHESGWDTELLVRKKALEYTLKNMALEEYDILHFATHGVVNMEEPSRCALSLQQDENEDGNLFASEIYNLPLNANLVTLSACETAVGAKAKGEGIIGLSRAFMFAGAKRLQVSLWTVSDLSTALLMDQFYRHFLNGKSPAQSLRLAKIHLIEHEEFNAPYFWAAFILIGD